MKKYTIKFSYQDRSNRGFNIKTAQRTVKANSLEDAVKKIESALMVDIWDATVIRESEI